MAAEGESLELFLNKATNPSTKDDDWEAILAFCDQINKELEGPQIAVRLLAHKIQSPQEKEALYALTTLESCVKNCGQRFHQEIGKFKFLNEVIKVVSPKYLGSYTTEKVKRKCIEIMYSWSENLTHEPKVIEAYSMLKKQGIVTEDPTYIDQTFEPPPLPREKDSIFDDEDKSKQLARLLKSKNPEDLQAANRLIKNMVKQDMERMEKESKRTQELETVNNNVKLLTEMLQCHTPGNSTESDQEILKELYESLEKRRPNLFRLASDTDDKDNDAMTDILKTNDDVVRVMTLYQKVVEGKTEENGLILLSDSNTKDTGITSLLDESLDLITSLEPSQKSNTELNSFSNGKYLLDENEDNLFSKSLLDDPLSSLGSDKEKQAKSDIDELGDIFGATPTRQSNSNQQADLGLLDLNLTPVLSEMNNSAHLQLNHTQTNTFPDTILSSHPLTSTTVPATTAPLLQPVSLTSGLYSPLSSSNQTAQGDVVTGILTPMVSQTSSGQSNTSSSALQASVCRSSSSTINTQSTTFAGMAGLDALGQSLLKQSLGSTPSFSHKQSSPAPKLNEIPISSISANSLPQQPMQNPLLISASTPAEPPSVTGSPAKSGVVEALTNVQVSLESIQPGSEQPVSAYDKNNVKVVFHIGKDRPRPDVMVMVVSTMSTNTSPVKKFQFQAAVPKVMKVKLQTPSATDLPAYNPILPPAAITQVMLIANPQKENIKLKYKITFSLDDKNVSDVGDVDNFPVR